MADLYPSSVQPVATTGDASGDFGIPVLAPLSVDGMPVDAVKSALRLQTAAQQISGSSERFWSSPPRTNGDRLREVYEVALSSDRPLNRISFHLARFPHRAWVQWRDRDGVWHPLLQARTRTPVQISIMDSLPAVIPTGVAGEEKLHPQHFGAGHWMPQLMDVVPVTTGRVRIVMTRLPSSGAPVGTDGQPVPYSLGVKDVVLSYRAASLEDLPWLPQQDTEHSVPIAGSSDLLGSQVEYVLRRTRAANLLPPAQGVWRCAPQPVPTAVVSLHLDLRTADSHPQVIDRVHLEPVTSGPRVNLYYSDDVAPARERFASADTPLTLPLARASTDLPVATSEGLLFATPRSYLDIDRRAVQLTAEEPLLLAMVVQPQVASTDPSQLTVLDTGHMTVLMRSGSVIVRLGERQVELAPVTYGVNARIPVAVSYDGSVLTVRTPWETRSQQNVHVVDGSPAPVLRLGGPLVGEGGSVRLRSLFLARGRAGDIDTIERYWDDPRGFALPPGHGVNASRHTSANGVLCLDASLITPGLDSVCPWGLIGGPAVDYDSLVWTPIPGDFTVRKGLLKFRPVKARYLKLEFTNLSPTLITPQTGAVVTTKLHPSAGVAPSPVVASGETVSGVAPVGATVAVQQGTAFSYADAPRRPAATSNAPFLPTEALYAPDPLDAQMLRRTGTRFPYQPLPSAAPAARFSSTGRHQYHVVQLPLDTTVGYTVAISGISVYLSDPVAERDTEQYVELFHSTEYLSGYREDEQGGWRHTGSAMVTSDPPWSGSRITSKTFISRRRVLGVQLAGQSSPPKQLVADPDFDDPSLHFWRPVGDATITSSAQYAASIGRMAEVVRGHALSSWGALERQFPTWDAIEGSNPLPNRPLWWEVENATSEADSGGIESLRPVTPAPGGRLYAAARVYTEGALAEPLRLQLVNGDGRILAEAVQEIGAAQVVEWYVGATIHTQSPTDAPTWDTVSAAGTRSWTAMEALGSWGDIGQDWAVDDVRDVRVRLIQQGANGTGRWLVDSLAVFNDPVVWEISRDGGTTWHEMVGIRNDPRGVFMFPAGLPATDRSGGTQLRWRITGYAPDVSVSSVVLRPWYATLSGAVPYQDTLQASGSATSLADYYPPVDADPYFQAWHHPIPQDWWLAARQWAHQQHPVTPPLPAITLPETVVEGTNEGAPPAPARHVLPAAFVINR